MEWACVFMRLSRVHILRHRLKRSEDARTVNESRSITRVLLIFTLAGLPFRSGDIVANGVLRRQRFTPKHIPVDRAGGI